MKAVSVLAAGFVLMACLIGCQARQSVVVAPAGTVSPEPTAPPPKLDNYAKQLAPGELALRRITDPAEIPDFTLACSNLSNLREAVRNSLDYLGKPSSRRFFPYGPISHRDAEDTLKAFLNLIDSGSGGAELNLLIRRYFDVYASVGCDGRGTVLFTGYYTPIFEGSARRSERFRYPLYGQPEDLVKNAEGTTIGRRTPNGTAPYPPRTELEDSGALKGKEIMWLGNPFEVYIVHVQGSARIRQPDGSEIGIGYAATNGHEYQSVSQRMVSDGVLSKDQVSLSSMIAYFKAHPDRISHYTGINPRFVFFQISDGTPRGSLNEPVTAMRTIATDKSIYPRGCLAFLSATLPRERGTDLSQEKYAGFALDQDTGGAIRAPGRCDLYMGQGDAAGRLAGKTFGEGRLYYLFVKPEYRDRLVQDRDARHRQGHRPRPE